MKAKRKKVCWQRYLQKCSKNRFHRGLHRTTVLITMDSKFCTQVL